MPRYKLLALDIDRTLVNSRDELTSATKAAVRRACNAGIRVVLATGRPYTRALPLVEPLGLDVPIVSASGGLIKHPLDHRTLFRADFLPNVLLGTIQTIHAAGFDSVLYTDGHTEGFYFYYLQWDAQQREMAEYLARNAEYGRARPDLLTAPPPDVFAAFSMGDRPAMLNLCAELQSRFYEKLYVHVIRSPRYIGWMCEIAPGGISKWSGIQHLARDWGIGDEEICAVGDDVNDIPMVQGAGLGVAMDNAVAELKAAADRVAPCHDSDGLVDVVAWLLD